LKIKFGTGGWRGIMGEDFTFDNLRIVVQAYINVLKKRYKKKKIIIAVDYDSRFFSKKFAYRAADLFSRNNIEVFLPSRDTPIPALSYKIVKNNLQGGIIITASNNPPRYNGVKLFSKNGASLNEDYLKKIEKEIENVKKDFDFIHRYPKSQLIKNKNFYRAYLDYISSKIDIQAIKDKKIKVVVDPLYGSAREYIDNFFIDNDLFVETVHNFRDPYFGGTLPTIKPENLKELSEKVLKTESDVGIAIDLDGDRFGIIDEKGVYIHPNLILSLILDYLIKAKNFRGTIAKSVATTSLIKKIAEKNGIKVVETPVGAKYISYLIVGGKVELGAEQSAGFWYKPQLNEKDGIFGGLIVTEMLAYYKKPLSLILKKLINEYGKIANIEKNLSIQGQVLDKYRQFCNSYIREVEGKKVKKVVILDGKKLIFEDDSWLLIRKSGNEPVIRFYAEGKKTEETEAFISRIVQNFKNEKK